MYGDLFHEIVHYTCNNQHDSMAMAIAHFPTYSTVTAFPSYRFKYYTLFISLVHISHISTFTYTQVSLALFILITHHSTCITTNTCQQS